MIAELIPMSLDDIHDIDDYSEITMQAMIDRLRRSRSEEHFVYRETELDEMWRVVDISINRALGGSLELAGLNELRRVIECAHDLVGMEGKPVEAAEALEAILPKIVPDS